MMRGPPGLTRPEDLLIEGPTGDPLSRDSWPPEFLIDGAPGTGNLPSRDRDESVRRYKRPRASWWGASILVALFWGPLTGIGTLVVRADYELYHEQDRQRRLSP